MNKPESVPSAERAAAAPVFISYATADRKEALAVCKAIERRGTSCWISSRDVKPGENYQEAIVRTIRNSPAMVLVFSEAANNSDEIKKELSLASKHHVPLMALRIEDVEPADAFAYELSTRQWIDAFDNWDKSVDALVETLNHVQRREAGSAEAPSARTGRRARLTSRTGIVAGTAVTLLAVVVGSGWFFLRPTGPVHSMQVRLTGFTRSSPDLPPMLPSALNDEIDAAFNDQGVVGVSTAAAPPPGNGPAYALGGSVGHDGDKVDVVVRLTNERTGTNLWSNSFRYDSSGLSRVPRWAAAQVSEVVRCGLFGASTYPKALPDHILADYLEICGPSSPTKDLDLAHKIVASAPDFSWGWSAVARAALGSAYSQPKGPKRDALLKEGIVAADKAVAIDASNSEALTVKSNLINPNDLIGREVLLKKAISARALACGCEHQEYGAFLMQVGRVTDAIREFSRSTDVLPLDADTQWVLARACLVDRNPSCAQQRFDAIPDIADLPGFADHITVAKATITGTNNGADKAMLNSKFGVYAQNVAALADAFAALDSDDPQAKSRALAELNALKPDWINDPEVPLFASLGDNADAIRYLEANVQRGNPAAYEWLWYPSMDGLRRDPAFPALLQRIGLMRYWKVTHTKPDVCSDKNASTFCAMI